MPQQGGKFTFVTTEAIDSSKIKVSLHICPVRFFFRKMFSKHMQWCFSCWAITKRSQGKRKIVGLQFCSLIMQSKKTSWLSDKFSLPRADGLVGLFGVGFGFCSFGRYNSEYREILKKYVTAKSWPHLFSLCLNLCQHFTNTVISFNVLNLMHLII